MPTPRPARTGRPSLRPVPDPTNPAGQSDQPATRGQPAAHGLYSKPPHSRAVLPAERQPMLADALRGVRLGVFDRQAIDWLCRWVDMPTFLALLGILQRARQATLHLQRPPAGKSTIKPAARRRQAR
jgi:hypothetical protein